jgi:hypothetical protein
MSRCLTKGSEGMRIFFNKLKRTRCEPNPWKIPLPGTFLGYTVNQSVRSKYNQRSGNMGLSLFLAIIGFGIVILGVVLLVILKHRKIATACFIIGLALIFVPYTYIYLFLD